MKLSAGMLALSVMTACVNNDDQDTGDNQEQRKNQDPTEETGTQGNEQETELGEGAKTEDQVGRIEESGNRELQADENEIGITDENQDDDQ